jgi:hypothetical protein
MKSKTENKVLIQKVANVGNRERKINGENASKRTVHRKSRDISTLWKLL